MIAGSLAIDFHGHELILHPEGAVWWPASGSLILSDVHFGKSATFRAHGIPVPEGVRQEDLDRIDRLIAQLDAQSLHIVGDFLHSNASIPAPLEEELQGWLDRLPCEVTLILGNHDPSPAQLRSLDGLRCLDQEEKSGITLIHDPADAQAGRPTIAGHLHPLCRIGGKRGPGIRVPGFYLWNSCLVLPAFGTFTSGSLVELRGPRCAFHPIIDGKVQRAIRPK
ncbi:ligase-associated DNA damage response endonuclease PdeM [Haloferula rosea]|uniref:Ligase-associated DNA damage response endonuclease PdeM n=1 Tax=Haloferula rosea TaxID=490093 RepID=A0A934REY6_9BACT|nr:ligase-associated DNA damage response endonuclease PdeM [Haloferula rosea]MBK1827949.1 ligase-associated DNA damage response endonuclease PdeM [Haloferula rosea]